MNVEFRILGPLEVRSESRPVALGGIKPRALLAVLLMHPNEPVHAERLALALWGEDAPASAVKTVQVYVSRLRKAFDDADALSTTPAGYCLRVRPGELDAQRFEGLVEEGCDALTAGEAEHAADVLREALALWRGPPLADFAFEAFAQTEIARLQEQRLAAVEARVEADLAAGRHPALIGELRQLLAANPTRERLAGQLMLALYRCGQQADALDAYHATRRVLTEIGVQPGPELRRLHEAILRQDGSLEPPSPISELPQELDAGTHAPLEGRDAELASLREHWERARTGRGAVATVTGERGIGKSRLAAEFAREVHRLGATVLYANGAAPAERVLVALARAREATGPTLLVVDDADQAGANVLVELEKLTHDHIPVLALALSEDIQAPSGVSTDSALPLGPLDAQAVCAIASRYSPGHADEDVPGDWLLDASGGIPRRVHEVARQWARRQAARRVGAVAERTATGRAELRSMESELAGDVVELQAAGDRGSLNDDASLVVCPFKGLASFDVADAPYFFGRERLVAELVARLVGAPLLGVVGPSGSGKSSVMRAGLLPALASGVLPGSATWTQALIRPGEHPLRTLNDAMTEIADAERVVLAVDQFEETFTTCEDEAERAAFIAELASMAGEVEDHCVVVIALRADYYGRCAAYPELARKLASNHVLVRSMQRDELRRAIELPAQRVGLQVDPELAEALVADVKDEPGALPLLSTALLELWQRRDGRRLRYTVYEQTGGVDGAVARLAEDAFGELDDQQQVIARGVLMRLAGEGAAGGVERRRVALAELEADRSEEVARIVVLLTDRRLLTVSSGTIELAHEALMREWPRLRNWIDADREGLRIHRNLNSAARGWQELGRDDGALYRGARLTEAIEWNEAQRPRLNETERAFLRACEAARQRDRVMRRRRIALAFGSLAVVLVAISVVAVVSISRNREARHQRDVAASRELAARAASLLDSDPGLSRLIALAAYKRDDTEQAETAVRQATLADRTAAILRADADRVYNATPSADFRLVATAGDDGSVRIWNLQRRRVVSSIEGHGQPARAASFSPDGTRVATAGEDGEVAIADVNGHDRHVVLTIPPGKGKHPTYPSSVEFSFDASKLVVGARDGTVRLIDLEHRKSGVLGRHRGEVEGSQGVRMARFDKHATRVVSAGFDGFARIWDVGRSTSLPLDHGKAWVIDASFSPDGRHVATASSDGRLRIWDARSGHRLFDLKVVPGNLLSVRYSPDGTRLVTGADDGVVRVYDARRAIQLADLKGHHGYVYDAAFAARSAIVSCGEDGTLRIWAPPETTAFSGDATYPSFGADNQHVVSGDEQGHVHLWNVATGNDRRLPGHAAHRQTVVQQSADGSRIVSASDAGTVRSYEVKSRKSQRLASDDAQKFAIAVDRNGRRIAVAGEGPLIHVDALDGGASLELRDGNADVNDLAFSPDAKHLVSASQDGKARIFNVNTGQRERILSGHVGAVSSVAYSGHRERIVTGGTDATIRIWRVRRDAPLVLYGHQGSVKTAVFNDRGDRVVSTGDDGTVRVWDAVSGRSLVVLQQYEVATGADFSPDGRFVVSAGSYGINGRRILRVSRCEVCGPFADVLRIARSRADRKLSSADRTRLLAGGP